MQTLSNSNHGMNFRFGGKTIFPHSLIVHISVCFGIAFFLIMLSGCKQDTGEDKANITIAKDLPRPSWIPRDPLALTGNHDDIALFRRRVGGNPVWQEDDYITEHTDEAVKKLKDAGVTMAVIHFYKAYGLEAEKGQLEDAKKLTALCKKYGIKVAVYVGSTIAFETFLLEKPEAQEWIVPDYLGSPVRYGGTQVFRKRVYFMHPGYIEYMKRVLRIAIEDLKVDMIHFDNTSMQAQPPIFFHPMAIEDFKKYLTNKYTPEMLKKRLGFSDVRYVEPPKYNQPLSTIDDPLFQEWADFRCQQLADYYGIMERYIRSLNPEVAVETNPHSGMSGNNTIWDQGVDYPRLLSHTDYMWTEEGNEAAVNEEGVLISKIRTFKMARTLNNRLLIYSIREGGNKLENAESMAYNRQCMGTVTGFLGVDNLPEDQKNYIKFFHKNFDLYRDIDYVADVAVLHSYATMAYNNDRPYQSTFLFEQALIQKKIPFDIIFDDNLKNISKYKVLILADQECLNDEKLDLIRKFVNDGGGLIATEHTSLYTEWRQRKREFGLNDLFQVTAPAWHGTRTPEDILNIPVQKKQVGKGKVVYIPEIKPAVPKPPAAAMLSRYWKLPVNLNELIESVQWASDNSLSLNIEAPLTVTMELNQKEDKSAMILHLVNFDLENPPVQNIKVNVRVPEGKKVTQVIIMTPDGRNDEIIQFKNSEDRIAFTVPQLSVYNLVAIKLE